MGDKVRKVGTKEDFDSATMDYVKRFVLYRRSLGVIGEDVQGPWMRFDNFNQIDLPMSQSIQVAGFEPFQMVDVHSIYALTGRQDPPTESQITRSVIHPNSPPGCIGVCFVKKGKMELDERQSRVVVMEGPGGLKNGGQLTLPSRATVLDWVRPGVPYTVYECYVLSQQYQFPEELGRKLLLELAIKMDPTTTLSV